MNPYRKGVLAVLCSLALGMMFVGGMQLGLEASKYALQKKKHEKAQPSPTTSDSSHRQAAGQPPKPAVGRCVFYAVPLLGGLALLIMSSAIAKRLTEDYDE